MKLDETDVNFGELISQRCDMPKANSMVVFGPSLTRGPDTNKKMEILERTIPRYLLIWNYTQQCVILQNQ
jgi:hypothetical protein